MRRQKYYIEIRYFGKAKHHIRRIINNVDNKFNLRKGHKVPHITLIQPFSTRNQKRLVSDFKRICSKQKKLMEFTVDGIGVFPFFVVFAKVKPSDELFKFRNRLMNKLRKYCRITSVNRPYKPHTTIALRMGFLKFFRIWFYLKSRTKILFTNHVIRATLLKGNKILYEYDFMQKRLLNRRKATSGKVLSNTFKGLERRKKK